MAKEYEQSEWAGKGEPAQADMGYTKINYGEQRMGDGVTEEESKTYVEPGDEGATAVSLQRGNGGISSHESYDNPMKASPTGE